eukprot:m.265245 g.265245  ORF g.265245 m.265245 type:complete len:427 (+) comp16236_c0_seq6:62-1342(+)
MEKLIDVALTSSYVKGLKLKTSGKNQPQGLQVVNVKQISSNLPAFQKLVVGDVVTHIDGLDVRSFPAKKVLQIFKAGEKKGIVTVAANTPTGQAPITNTEPEVDVFPDDDLAMEFMALEQQESNMRSEISAAELAAESARRAAEFATHESANIISSPDIPSQPDREAEEDEANRRYSTIDEALRSEIPSENASQNTHERNTSQKSNEKKQDVYSKPKRQSKRRNVQKKVSDAIISFCPEDEEIATQLLSDLKEQGISAVMDKTDRGTFNLMRDTGMIIGNVSCLVPILSPNFMASTLCQEELALAYITNTPIVPICIVPHDFLLMDTRTRLLSSCLNIIYCEDGEITPNFIEPLVQGIKTERENVKQGAYQQTQQHANMRSAFTPPAVPDEPITLVDIYIWACGIGYMGTIRIKLGNITPRPLHAS